MMSNRERAMNNRVEENEVLDHAVELVTNKFYFAVLKKAPRRNIENLDCFCIDKKFEYEPFCDDFGPLNLGQLYLYCEIVTEKMADQDLKLKKIVHYTLDNSQTRVNAAVLAGQYCIMMLSMDPFSIARILTNTFQFIDYRDASTEHPSFFITLKDCLAATAKAKEHGMVDFGDFCYQDYAHYECVQHGDMNWIIPGKFLAFAGPHARPHARVSTRGGPSSLPCSSSVHTPDKYVPYFKTFNVTAVVRLNQPLYDSQIFKNEGISHHDLIFTDGGTPSDDQLNRFLNIVENAQGAVAVHCKAGLGRTGTMISAYLMKWYKFTCREAIAWSRICRPASVIGQQQIWLYDKQVPLWLAGANVDPPVHSHGIYSFEVGLNFFWDADRNRPEVPEIEQNHESDDENDELEDQNNQPEDQNNQPEDQNNQPEEQIQQPEEQIQQPEPVAAPVPDVDIEILREIPDIEEVPVEAKIYEVVNIDEDEESSAAQNAERAAQRAANAEQVAAAERAAALERAAANERAAAEQAARAANRNATPPPARPTPPRPSAPRPNYSQPMARKSTGGYARHMPAARMSASGSTSGMPAARMSASGSTSGMPAARMSASGSTSGTPAASATLTTPATSSTPGTPAASATLRTPATSATSGTPATSATSGTPATSATPGTPATSATPGKPARGWGSGHLATDSSLWGPAGSQAKRGGYTSTGRKVGRPRKAPTIQLSTKYRPPEGARRAARMSCERPSPRSPWRQSVRRGSSESSGSSSDEEIPQERRRSPRVAAGRNSKSKTLR